MKLITLVFSVAMTSLVCAAFAAPLAAIAEETTLSLEVDGIEQHTGQIAVAIFSDKQAYKSGEPAMGSALADADGATITIEIDGLEAGPCAIKIFHDVNGNGELDSNLMGMPTEPFGFSNGAVARFGPPGFDDAVFQLEAGANKHAISLSSL